MDIVPHDNQYLSPGQSEELSDQLDLLLADFQVFQQNVNQIHWSPQLRPYFNFSQDVGRVKEVLEPTKEVIASKILRLGHAPSVSSTNYMIKASLYPVEGIDNLDDAMKLIIINGQELLKTVKEIFDFATELNEQFTISLMHHLAERLSYMVWHFSQQRMAQMN